MPDDPFSGGGGHHESGAEKTLNAKIGGVPAWGIGITLAAAVVGYSLWKGNKTADNMSAASQPPTDTGQGTGGGGSIGYEVPWYPPYYSPPYSQSPPSPATNAQWESVVADWLRSKGEVGVDEALDDYLDGRPLNSEDRHLISLAEKFWGAPPQGLPMVPQSPVSPSIPAEPDSSLTGDSAVSGDGSGSSPVTDAAQNAVGAVTGGGVTTTRVRERNARRDRDRRRRR